MSELEAWVDGVSKGKVDVRAINPCARGNQIGSTVFVPSGRGKSFSLRVRGVTPAGAIEATRRIRYFDRSSLELPITLSTRCLNVTCPRGETCVEGKCEGNAVTEDGGLMELDAGVGWDAGAADGSSPKCDFPGPALKWITEIDSWTFDEGEKSKSIWSAKMVKTNLSNAVELAPSDPGCGTALVMKSYASLGTTVAPSPNGIGVSVMVRATKTTEVG